MKKALAITLIVALIMLVACSAGDNSVPQSQSIQNETSAPASSAVPDTHNSKPVVEFEDVPVETDAQVLVAYFTMPETTGVDAVAGASRVVADGELTGNTQYVASVISENTGGELFAIETAQGYPADHDELVEYADQEQALDARPELASHIENPEDYDVIFIGYPNWWGDFPMPLYSFLEEYDFSGKTLVPFNTHGGSQFSNTISIMGQMQPGATVEQDGFTVSRNEVGSSESAIISWLDGLNTP